MASSFFTSSIILQTVIFIISSTILILVTKPFVKKFVDIKTTNTNAYSIIGKNALVIKEIDPIQSIGQIKVDGEVWSAESQNNEVIPKGSEVKVIAIEGVKAIVKAVKIAENI